MTTPERIRRRQRIEGAFLIILGTASVVYAVFDNRQDQRVLDCIVRVATEQNAVLDAGREAQRLERRAGEIEQAADERLIGAALRGEIQTPEDVQAAQTRYDAQQVRADRKRERADDARLNSPVPPDPTTVCQ